MNCSYCGDPIRDVNGRQCETCGHVVHQWDGCGFSTRGRFLCDECRAEIITRQALQLIRFDRYEMPEPCACGGTLVEEVADPSPDPALGRSYKCDTCGGRYVEVCEASTLIPFTTVEQNNTSQPRRKETQ